MRKRSPANSDASSPPVPARISRMTLRSSIASFGISASLISCSSACRASLRRAAVPRRRRCASPVRSPDRRSDASRPAISATRAAIGPHLLHHRIDLGELAGQLDIRFGSKLARELGGERRVARQHEIELALRKHDMTLQRNAFGRREGRRAASRIDRAPFARSISEFTTLWLCRHRVRGPSP